MITSNEERSWPIDLFRYNESTGWEREIGGDKEGIATMTSARKGRYVTRRDAPSLDEELSPNSSSYLMDVHILTWLWLKLFY